MGCGLVAEALGEDTDIDDPSELTNEAQTLRALRAVVMLGPFPQVGDDDGA